MTPGLKSKRGNNNQRPKQKLKVVKSYKMNFGLLSKGSKDAV